jgi:hypothetical protein
MPAATAGSVDGFMALEELEVCVAVAQESLLKFKFFAMSENILTWPGLRFLNIWAACKAMALCESCSLDVPVLATTAQSQTSGSAPEDTHEYISLSTHALLGRPTMHLHRVVHEILSPTCAS